MMSKRVGDVFYFALLLTRYLRPSIYLNVNTLKIGNPEDCILTPYKYPHFAHTHTLCLYYVQKHIGKYIIYKY